MLREADERAPLETGGVLLGVADALNVWIDAVVGPGPSAVHGKTSFAPDAAYQERLIADIYERSGRRATYLGDWHTHPGVSPHLSWRDRRTLRTIAASSEARQPTPIMLVYGYGHPWRVKGWRYMPAPWYVPTARVRELRLTLTD